MKKASVFLTVFIVALVLGVMYLSYMQNEYAQIVNKPQLGQYSSDVAELLKQYGGQSADVASKLATYDFAGQAVSTPDNGFWISYGLSNVPELDQTKRGLEGQIVSLLNSYLADKEGKDYGNVKFERIALMQQATVLVDEASMNKGDYDEHFDVMVSGAGDNVISSPTSGSQTVSGSRFTVTVNNWRFWYMYRKFKDWVISGGLSSEACNSLPKVAIQGSNPECTYPAIDQDTVTSLMQRSVKNLQGRFDSYVTCSYTIDCNHAQTKVISDHTTCPPRSGSVTGSKGTVTYDCKAGCGNMACTYKTAVPAECTAGGYPDPFCSSPLPPFKSGSIAYTGGDWKPSTGKPSRVGDCYGLGENYTLSFIATVSCIDSKYKQPISAAAMNNLVFSTRVHMFLSQYQEAPGVVCDADACIGAAAAQAGVFGSEDPGKDKPGSCGTTCPTS